MTMKEAAFFKYIELEDILKPNNENNNSIITNKKKMLKK